MKKIIGIAILLLLLACKPSGRKSVYLTMRYNPNAKYAEVIDRNTKTTIRYSGSDEFMQRLNDNGVSNPKIDSSNFTMLATLLTGKINKKHIFPLSISFDSIIGKQQFAEILHGLKIYGYCEKDSMPRFDSVSLPDVTNEMKQPLLKMVSGILSQFQLPSRKVSIGDTIMQKIPLSFPIGKLNIEMTETVIYKLKDISNGIAHFDFSYTIVMAMSDENQFKADGGGSGQGQIEYNIKDNYFNNYSGTTSIHMKMTSDQFSMDLQTVEKTNQTIEKK